MCAEFVNSEFVIGATLDRNSGVVWITNGDICTWVKLEEEEWVGTGTFLKTRYL